MASNADVSQSHACGQTTGTTVAATNDALHRHCDMLHRHCDILRKFDGEAGTTFSKPPLSRNEVQVLLAWEYCKDHEHEEPPLDPEIVSLMHRVRGAFLTWLQIVIGSSSVPSRLIFVYGLAYGGSRAVSCWSFLLKMVSVKEAISWMDSLLKSPRLCHKLHVVGFAEELFEQLTDETDFFHRVMRDALLRLHDEIRNPELFLENLTCEAMGADKLSINHHVVRFTDFFEQLEGSGQGGPVAKRKPGELLFDIALSGIVSKSMACNDIGMDLLRLLMSERPFKVPSDAVARIEEHCAPLWDCWGSDSPSDFEASLRRIAMFDATRAAQCITGWVQLFRLCETALRFDLGQLINKTFDLLGCQAASAEVRLFAFDCITYWMGIREFEHSATRPLAPIAKKFHSTEEMGRLVVDHMFGRGRLNGAVMFARQRLLIDRFYKNVCYEPDTSGVDLVGAMFNIATRDWGAPFCREAQKWAMLDVYSFSRPALRLRAVHFLLLRAFPISFIIDVTVTNISIQSLNALISLFENGLHDKACSLRVQQFLIDWIHGTRHKKWVVQVQSRLIRVLTRMLFSTECLWGTEAVQVHQMFKHVVLGATLRVQSEAAGSVLRKLGGTINTCPKKLIAEFVGVPLDDRLRNARGLSMFDETERVKSTHINLHIQIVNMWKNSPTYGADAAQFDPTTGSAKEQQAQKMLLHVAALGIDELSSFQQRRHTVDEPSSADMSSRRMEVSEFREGVYSRPARIRATRAAHMLITLLNPSSDQRSRVTEEPDHKRTVRRLLLQTVAAAVAEAAATGPHGSIDVVRLILEEITTVVQFRDITDADVRLRLTLLNAVAWVLHAQSPLTFDDLVALEKALRPRFARTFSLWLLGCVVSESEESLSQDLKLLTGKARSGSEVSSEAADPPVKAAAEVGASDQGVPSHANEETGKEGRATNPGAETEDPSREQCGRDSGTSEGASTCDEAVEDDDDCDWDLVKINGTFWTCFHCHAMNPVTRDTCSNCRTVPPPCSNIARMYIAVPLCFNSADEAEKAKVWGGELIGLEKDKLREETAVGSAPVGDIGEL